MTHPKLSEYWPASMFVAVIALTIYVFTTPKLDSVVSFHKPIVRSYRGVIFDLSIPTAKLGLSEAQTEGIKELFRLGDVIVEWPPDVVTQDAAIVEIRSGGEVLTTVRVHLVSR